MSATSLPSQSTPISGPVAAQGESCAEINAGCRAAVPLFLSAAGWLIAASVLGMIATLKFHSPNLLADHPWFTYGRVHPAASNALVYGFALQAGLGVMLWLVCHIGRAKLSGTPMIIAGWLMLNLGVILGVLGILLGENTGFEWLEMPRYASVFVFVAYLIIGAAAVLAFHQRAERRLSVSQWFLLAALFWFPWIYSTANLLLVASPVRGVMQTVINCWYANNLNTIWFGFVGLAAIFYFIPKIIGRPLASNYLGLFTFWGLVIFGSWGGVLPAAPVPAWLPAMSTFAAVLTIVPILAVASNLKQTTCGHVGGNLHPSLKFFVFGSLVYVVASLIKAVTSLSRVSEILNFTWFLPAQTQLFLYGFFAMTMFGAVYYIVPRLTGIEFPSPKLIGMHFYFSAAGILIYFVALGIGGLKQGFDLNTTPAPFLAVSQTSLNFLRISTVGDLLMALGHVAFFLNLLGMMVRLCTTAATSAWAAGTNKAGVAS